MLARFSYFSIFSLTFCCIWLTGFHHWLTAIYLVIWYTNSVTALWYLFYYSCLLTYSKGKADNNCFTLILAKSLIRLSFVLSGIDKFFNVKMKWLKCLEEVLHSPPCLCVRDIFWLWWNGIPFWLVYDVCTWTF